LSVNYVNALLHCFVLHNALSYMWGQYYIYTFCYGCLINSTMKHSTTLTQNNCIDLQYFMQFRSLFELVANLQRLYLAIDFRKHTVFSLISSISNNY